MRRVITLILALATLATMTTTAFAALPEEPIVSPQYTYIEFISTGLTVQDATFGVLSISAYCLSASGTIVQIECMLQQYSGGWNTIKTWNASGIVEATLDKQYAVAKGYSYRIYVTYSIRNSSGALLESTIKTRSCYY